MSLDDTDTFMSIMQIVVDVNVIFLQVDWLL